MPITQSAQKALRQTKKRTARNLAQKKALAYLIKRLSAKNFSLVFSKIDKLAKNRIISPQKASRLKARLHRTIQPGKLSPRKNSSVKKAASKQAASLKRSRQKTTRRKRTS